MKRIILILALGIFQVPFLHGQKTVSRSMVQPEIVVDTISDGSSICLDATVVHFTESLTRNGVYTRIDRNSHCSDDIYKSGDVIIIDNIISIDKNGKQTKLPPRKYVVF